MQKSIEDYETRYKESLETNKNDTEYLKNLGCSELLLFLNQLIIRFDLFQRFLADIPENICIS